MRTLIVLLGVLALAAVVVLARSNRAGGAPGAFEGCQGIAPDPAACKAPPWVASIGGLTAWFAPPALDFGAQELSISPGAPREIRIGASAQKTRVGRLELVRGSAVRIGLACPDTGWDGCRQTTCLVLPPATVPPDCAALHATEPKASIVVESAGGTVRFAAIGAPAVVRTR